MKHFQPDQDPAEGLGVLMLFQLIEEALPAFFRTDRVMHVARAPGRLDVIGGQGAGRAQLSVALPTAEAACAAIQARDDDLIRLWSPCRDGSRTQLLSLRLGDLGLPEAPVDYERARALLGDDPRDRWAGYLFGGLLALAREHALVPTHGVDLLLHSDIPTGCGVSSSTAVVVTALRSFATLFDVDLSPAEQARLAQIVERDVMAVDGRIADARAAVSCERDELLLLRGAAADVEGSLQVPSDLEVVGLATGTTTAAAAADADDAERARIERFCELLGREPSLAHRSELGELMFASHRAYAGAPHGNETCDLVVDAARQRRDAGGGVYGARLSGRGGGGTVVLLGARGKVWYEALRVKKALLEATGHSGHIFRWSSPGAASFGSILLQPKG